MKNFQFGTIRPDPSGEGTIGDFALHVQCLQRTRLQELFPTYDAETRSLVNESDSLTVISLYADRFGGFDLELSGGIRLQVFSDGVGNENWRFFSPGSDEPHFVHDT